MKLHSRDEFRNIVLNLFGGRCCIPGCPNPAEDAHHIIERRLWPDGGYYVENGAPLCDLNGTGHHMEAEKNLILPQELRELCGHPIIIPDDWDDSLEYNKWGSVINFRGKYPRTFHLPSSLTHYKDDKVLRSLDGLMNCELVVTEKLDGENTTMTSDKIHARSVDSAAHPSQSWVRNLWSQIRQDIPDGWRICGENMYAEHSVHYGNLSTFFYVFSIWDDQTCMSWDDTVALTKEFGLTTVPVLYRGDDFSEAEKAWQLDSEVSEGYVVRDAGEIPLRLWSRKAGKFVRANHVRTLDHGWRFRNDYKTNEMRKS